MKKFVGILVALVIVLGGLLIFEYTKDNGEETKTKGEAATAITKEADWNIKNTVIIVLL